MIYVMSDIHGCYEEFIEILKLINLTDEDTLYILGDVIDKDSEPLKVLDYIMEHNNIQMLLGNHEYLLLKYFHSKPNTLKSYLNKLNWNFVYDGGYVTLNQLEKLSENEQKKYIDFLDSLPLYKKLTLNNSDYLLVHSGIRIFKDYSLKETLKNQKENDLLFSRGKFISSKEHLPFTVIFGHTPIKRIYKDYMKRDENNNFVIKKFYGVILEKLGCVKNKVFNLLKIQSKSNISTIDIKILKLQNKIAIDCGCYGGEKLSCLRLDDMKEFYVEKDKE